MPPAARMPDSIENHSPRIATRLAGEPLHPRTLRPRHHLLDPRGSIRVGGHDERIAALDSQSVGKLADRRGLAGSVDAVEEDTCGRAAEVELSRPLRHRSQGGLNERRLRLFACAWASSADR